METQIKSEMKEEMYNTFIIDHKTTMNNYTLTIVQARRNEKIPRNITIQDWSHKEINKCEQTNY